MLSLKYWIANSNEPGVLWMMRTLNSTKWRNYMLSLKHWIANSDEPGVLWMSLWMNRLNCSLTSLPNGFSLSASISITSRIPSINSTNVVLSESVNGLMTSDMLQFNIKLKNWDKQNSWTYYHVYKPICFALLQHSKKSIWDTVSLNMHCFIKCFNKYL